MEYVSIIITHFSQIDELNKESTIRSELLLKSIKSLVENTNYPVEVIVIDNGGRNDDSNVLLDYARAGKINTYIRNKNKKNY